MRKPIDLLRLTFTLLLAALVVVSNLPTLTARVTDLDNDGIVDDTEYYVAERIFPVVHYHTDETCIGPSGPAPFLFRARHPSIDQELRTDYILVNYVRLYTDDCGSLPHDGDNEAFQVLAKWSGSDWEFEYMAAVAHWGDATFEHSTSSSNFHLWISEDKHAGYVEFSECNFPDDCESTGNTSETLALHNVGEWSDQLQTDLGFIDSAFDNENPWNPNDKFLNAGYIFFQLFNSGKFEKEPIWHEGQWRHFDEYEPGQYPF
jgi:hypothetical protein